MPKYTKLENHLSLSELQTNYRKAQDPVARSQWHIIWLLAQQKRVSEVVSVTGYSAGWIRCLARRYNQNGPSTLGDHRHQAKGQAPLLSTSQQAELKIALLQPPDDGGLWNGPKVAAWIKAKRDGQYDASEVGNTSINWALASKYPAPITSRLINKLKLSLKKLS